jgi:RNA polymerase-binding transcription factor
MKLHDDGYRIELEQKAEDLRQSLRHPGKIAVERTYRLLRQVEVALARFQTGKYGSCLKCEREIPEKRLKAIPWAVYCVQCQEKVDRLQGRMRALRKPAA